ncbi:hypothetical protein ACFL67_04320, partial [candidate division KSB1 bacterium]
AGILTGTVLYFADMNLWIAFVLCPVIYFIFLFAFKGIVKQDLEYLYELIPSQHVKKLISFLPF